MIKRELDSFSRLIGGLRVYNEMISCGAKKLALGSPVYDSNERDEHWEYMVDICKEKGTKCVKDDDALITDLFEVTLNKDKHNIVFYKEQSALNEYLELKNRKKELVANGAYDEVARYKIAYDFGKLLSYSDKEIDRMIQENTEKEVFATDKLHVSSQITFIYFDDVPAAKHFFSKVLGLTEAVNQGDDYCSIYKTSKSSFLGVVDRTRGAVKATSRDGVLISLVVNNLPVVYEKLKSLNLSKLKEFHVSERLNIKSLTFEGPEGYKFEVEEFLDPETRTIMGLPTRCEF